MINVNKLLMFGEKYASRWFTKKWGRKITSNNIVVQTMQTEKGSLTLLSKQETPKGNLFKGRIVASFGDDDIRNDPVVADMVKTSVGEIANAKTQEWVECNAFDLIPVLQAVSSLRGAMYIRVNAEVGGKASIQIAERDCVVLLEGKVCVEPSAIFRYNGEIVKRNETLGQANARRLEKLGRLKEEKLEIEEDLYEDEEEEELL